MNLSDDSAYLPAGTEVSAKFKGAFCEAKIKKVEKCVKCKITLKSSNEQLTVSDETIRSGQGLALPLAEFKTGSLVHYCKEAGDMTPEQLVSGGHLAPATLNKVTDQSLYTVIFNDGDEKTTRRSFIRFKGTGKPPVAAAAAAGAVAAGLGSSFVSGLLATAGGSDDELDEDEMAAKKPAAAASLASTSKQTAADLADLLTNEDDETGHAGGAADDEDDDDESSSDSEEDYPSEEKDRFVAQLYKFMDDRGTPMNKAPSIQNVDLDLHKFFAVVKRFGGYNKCNKTRAWCDIYRRLALPVNSSSQQSARNVINLKCAYKRYLQPYEDFYRKLGSNFCDFPSLRNAASSSSSSSKRLTDRGLQVFKNRAVVSTATVSSAAKVKPGVSKAAKQPMTAPGPQKPPLGGGGHLILDSTPKLSSDSTSVKRSAQTGGTNLNEDILLSTAAVDAPPTLSSIVAESLSSLTPTRLADAADQQPPAEEITLSSMFRNIAEESKKAAKKEREKERKRYGDEDSSGDMPSPSCAEPVVSKPPPTATMSGKAQQRRGSAERLTTRSDDEAELTDDSAKAKRNKVNRTSQSNDEGGSGQLHLKSSLKRKSTGEPKESASGESSMNDGDDTMTVKSEPDTQESSAISYKTPLTIHDLEVNRLVDVKYGHGNQKSLYEAKIVQINLENNTILVHYLGWNNRYDEWVKLDKIIRMRQDDSSGNKRRKGTTRPFQPAPLSKTPKTASVKTPATAVAADQKPLKTPEPEADASKPPAEEGEQRSLSTGSSNSSDIKEDAAAEKTPNEVKQAAKTRDSMSSSSSASFARQSSSEEVKVSPAPKADPASLTTTKAAEATTDQSLMTPLLSIKEEIMEFETAIPPPPAPGSGHASPVVISGSQVDTLLKENKISSRSSSISSGGGDLSASSHSLKEFTIRAVADAPPADHAASSRTASPSRAATAIEAPVKSASKPVVVKGPAKKAKDGSPLVDSTSVELASHVSNVSSPASSTTSSSTTLPPLPPPSKLKTDAVVIDTNIEPTLGTVKAQNSPSLCSISSDYSDSNSPKKAYKSSSNTDLHLEVKAAPGAHSPSWSASKPETADSTETTTTKKKTSSRSVSTDEDRKEAGRRETAEPVVKPEETSSLTNISNQSASPVSSLKKPIATQQAPVQTENNSKYSFHVINPNLQGKQRIRFIEEQMRLCRDAYSKLKNEIANIDRKKKKLKRNGATGDGDAAASSTTPVSASLTSTKKSLVAEVK